MFNENLLDERKINAWKQQFNNAVPFRFLVIDNFLDPAIAAQLSREFPALEKMDVNYKGINEKKSEHSNFETLHPVFRELRNRITHPAITGAIEKIAGIEALETIGDRYGYGLHQGGTNSFLDIHVDYNLHPLRKKQRRLNLIIFLNPEWRPEWGGALEFWNREVTACVQSISPVFNRCVLFESHDYSYHGYSKISCPEHISRKSFYLYYFSAPGQRLLFHDTIFRATPDEKAIKKPVVYIKELVKNFIKRILYHTGLNRLMK